MSPTATEEQPRAEAERLRRELERLRADNARLEAEVAASNHQLDRLLDHVAAAVISADDEGRVTSVAGWTVELVGRPEAELIGLPVCDLLGFTSEADRVDALAGRGTREAVVNGPQGHATPVLVSGSGDGEGRVYTAIDVSDRKRLEADLRHAQRLEAIGSLAAGVAHELNTPIQYVIDSVRFLADVIDDLVEIDASNQAMRELLTTVDGGPELLEVLARKEVELDLEYSRQELPGAVDRALGGLSRVASIVKALKRFSHPGEDVGPDDVNQVVETAATLARHEYKYVADLELQLQPVPAAWCNRVQLSQVLVNLLVNAAQAIEDRPADAGRGRIVVATCAEPDAVRIDVTDDGGGIPAEIRDRIFDPFFTTKEPGRGTGQGLALAYDAVVNGFGGRIEAEVVDGVGTTFHIWLRTEATR